MGERILGMQNIQPQCDYMVSGEKLIQIHGLLERAKYIMNFHALRCPLHPFKNFSGMEEHLSEYRHVIKDIETLLLKMNYPECADCACFKCGDDYCKTEICQEGCIHYGKAHPYTGCTNSPGC
jgi:hypothetical protein